MLKIMIKVKSIFYGDKEIKDIMKEFYLNQEND